MKESCEKHNKRRKLKQAKKQQTLAVPDTGRKNVFFGKSKGGKGEEAGVRGEPARTVAQDRKSTMAG